MSSSLFPQTPTPQRATTPTISPITTGTTPQIDNNQALLGMYKQLKNSNGDLSALFAANPQYKKLQETYSTIMQLSNGNPEQLFRQRCQQQGVDPNTIINMLNSV